MKETLIDDDKLMFVEPVLMERIWGGSRLMKEWGYPSDKQDEIGECWAISANEEADCIVTAGRYKGRTITDLWNNERELFGNLPGERFPLLVKVIDAKEDLSIQVHPNDEYAKMHENSLGKNECWYVLDCPENATLVIGNKAESREEMEQMIKEERWSEFCNEVPVKKGDFLQIDPGTLHAIKSGFLLFETQQNSDITYRVYDYDRVQNGKKRELHLKESIDVLKAPDKWESDKILEVDQTLNKLVELIDIEPYRVWKLHIDREYIIDNSDFPFLLVSIIEGEGCVNGYAIKKGSHFIIPADYKGAEFTGNLDMIISTPHMD